LLSFAPFYKNGYLTKQVWAMVCAAKSANLAKRHPRLPLGPCEMLPIHLPNEGPQNLLKGDADENRQL